MNKNIDNELHRSLGRIEGKLDSMIAHNDSVDKILIDHTTKLNLLETFKDNLQGKMSIIGAVGGLIGGIITLIINRFIGK